jgi:hypothetical protein
MLYLLSTRPTWEMAATWFLVGLYVICGNIADMLLFTFG